MSRATHANRGRSLELCVIASQRDVVRVRKMTAGAKWIRGRMIAVRGPVDFVGTVLATGRSICFDAKQCGERTLFPLRKELKPHQLYHLIEQGSAGAVAGVLVEATHPEVQSYYWIGWRDAKANVASLSWTDSRVVRLGDSLHLIRFDRLLSLDCERPREGGSVGQRNAPTG